MSDYRAKAVPGLRVVPVTFAQANNYVATMHRHNGKLPTSILRVGVIDGDGLVRGVAIAGQPKARMLCDGGTLEVNRVCTDGAYNACSMLYAACIKAARALGYWRLVTYTLDSETGASLRASGWREGGRISGESWTRRQASKGNVGYIDGHDTGDKHRWEITFGERPPVAVWPVTVDTHPTLFGGAA